MAVQYVEHVLVLHALEGPLAQDGFNLRAFARRAAFQGGDDGQGGFALAQIAGDRFAEHLFGSG